MVVINDDLSIYITRGDAAVISVGAKIGDVEYVADTKNYIDNKFTELQNAILSAGANV